MFLLTSPAPCRLEDAGDARLRAVRIALVALTCAAAGQWGWAPGQDIGQTPLFWPFLGIALAAALRFGPGVWPGIAVGAALASPMGAYPWWLWFALTVGNTLGPLVGAGMLHHLGFQRQIERRGDAVALVLCGAGLTASITATSGSVWLHVAGATSPEAFAPIWTRWWLSDSAGVLLLAVPCLSFSLARLKEAFGRPRTLRHLLLVLALIAVGALPPALGVTAQVSLLPLIFVPPLLVSWLAASGGLFLASAALLALACVSAPLAASGVGPWLLDSVYDAGPAASWTYFCMLALLPLLIAALLGEQQANDRRWQLALDSSETGVADWNASDDRIVVSSRWQALLGEPAAAWTGSPTALLDRVHPDDRHAFLRTLIFPLQSASTHGGPLDFRMRTRHGVWRWLEAHALLTDRHPDGSLRRAMLTARDISSQRAAEEKEQLSAKLFQHLHEGLVITDGSFRVLDVNPAYTHITGQPRQEMLGSVPALLRPAPEGSAEAAEQRTLIEGLRQHGMWRGEMTQRLAHGESQTLQVTVSAVQDPGGAARLHALAVSDITQARRQLEQLERQAHFDELTGLPNRARLGQMMEEALRSSEREGFLLTVCYLDLDHFKPVNDRYGHDAGDRLLVALGERLRGAMRHWASGSDTVARLGGDEFVLLLRTATLEEGRHAVERILRQVADPYLLGRGIEPIVITSSVGATVYPIDRSDADTLLRHADHAMYGAKQSGRNGYLFFDAELSRRTEAHFEAVARVQDALEAGQLMLYFQPKVNMRTARVLGMEALLRWKHPIHGVIPPAQFLPLIEQTPLSARIGDWVLQQGIEQLAAWQRQGLDLTLSINLSARHLQEPMFGERLAALLERHQSPVARRLVLEVLETAALADVDRTAALMQRCKELGVRFALDDFGTGYSTMTYLKRLPFDLLKVDRSFVQGMLADPQDLAIVQGIIGLSSTFGCSVVAEGVETSEQAQRLLAMGCEIGQGNGIAKAMPSDGVARWVQDYRGAPLDIQLEASSGAL